MPTSSVSWPLTSCMQNCRPNQTGVPRTKVHEILRPLTAFSRLWYHMEFFFTSERAHVLRSVNAVCRSRVRSFVTDFLQPQSQSDHYYRVFQAPLYKISLSSNCSWNLFIFFNYGNKLIAPFGRRNFRGAENMCVTNLPILLPVFVPIAVLFVLCKRCYHSHNIGDIRPRQD